MESINFDYNSSILLNDVPIEYLDTFPQPLAEDFPPTGIDITNFTPEQAFVVLKSQYCIEIINKMLSYGSHLKYPYIDVRVQELEPGEVTTRHGYWHLDSSVHPSMEYDNYLFVSGQHALTEFVSTVIPLPNTTLSREFSEAIDELNPEIIRIKSCTIVHYNGRNAHRGPIVTQKEKRLLIRLLNTNRKVASTYDYYDKGRGKRP